tara:strand:+ start:56868 stop:57122 length:255 start_codon:yes stop_codon:yes gene_type:complete
MKDNFTKITDGIYLVRTQAGFKQAINDCFGDDWQDVQLLLRTNYTNYPKSYPAVVSLSIGYCGDNYLHCNNVHVNVLREVIKDA